MSFVIFTIDITSPLKLKSNENVHKIKERSHAMCEIFDTSHRVIGQEDIHFISAFGFFLWPDATHVRRHKQE